MDLKECSKRILSFLLSAGMLFSAVPSSFILSSIVSVAESESATEEVHIWDGTADISWYDDEETEFHISTAEQLAGFAAIVNTGKTMEGKTFILDNDIYLNDVSTYDEWETIPPANRWTSVSKFSGTFQGDSHSIIGLYTTGGGMFNYITNGCISELNFSDLYVDIDFSNDVSRGGLVNTARASSVLNCSVQGNLMASKHHNAYCSLGGLIGECESCEIIGCSNISNILDIRNSVLSALRIGGICGYNRFSKIVNCVNKGNISSGYAGGICGYSYGTISNCINNGEITGTYSGGICCYNDYDEGKVLNSYNTGTIQNGSGICYDGSGSITNVYNVGKITSGYAISNGTHLISNAYYLSGTALAGGINTTAGIPNTTAKTETNMKKESFADSLGEAFYYVEGEYPKLAFEVGRTISNFDKTSLSFKEFGETQMLTLDTTYLGDAEWVSSDTSVATVDSDGVVTAVGNGTAMIYALCSDSKAACSVSVGYDYYLGDNELSLKKGRVHSLDVYSASTGNLATDIDVEWSSSDESVVSVDRNGQITANSKGIAAVTAKFADMELSCIVSVYEYTVPSTPVADDENAPKLSETDFSISTVESKQLSVINYVDSVTWVSANTAIAKVNEKGIVRPVAEGMTSIYALLSDGKCLKANVTVTTSEFPMGDVNLDGEFNVADAVLLQKWLLAVPNVELKCWENADFYEDNRLDVFDFCLLKQKLAESNSLSAQ